MELSQCTVGTKGNYRSLESEKRNVDTEGNNRRNELQMHTLGVDNTDATAPLLSVESDCQRKVDHIPIILLRMETSPQGWSVSSIPQGELLSATMEGNNMTDDRVQLIVEHLFKMEQK